jgi:DNA recombination-dependent growth factor C
MGTRVPYSDVLQEGTDNMPAREHNILFDESFMILVEMVGEYVTEPLDKAFGPAAS